MGAAVQPGFPWTHGPGTDFPFEGGDFLVVPIETDLLWEDPQKEMGETRGQDNRKVVEQKVGLQKKPM